MSNTVFDYTAGTPWIITDEIKTAIDRSVNEGRSVRDAVRRETTRQIRSSSEYSKACHDRYLSAGVDVVSITVNGSSLQDDIQSLQARFDAADWLYKVTAPEDTRTAAADDSVGVVLNTQNLGAAIGDDLGAIEPLYNAGLRIFQLTYNLHNSIGSGCYGRSKAHLSQFGVEAIERIQNLGGVVDLSHCGPETTHDAIEVIDAPPAFTHASCASVANHPRAKTDDEIEALSHSDGYMGIVGVPWFLDPNDEDPPLDIFLDHLDHATSILGINNVGVGTDFTHVDAGLPDKYATAARQWASQAGFPDGYGENYGKGFDTMQRYQDWSRLRELIESRYTDKEAQGILGENFVNYWERVVEASADP
jgi:membrane dipeptidase